MRMQLPLSALGFALVAGVPAANAQTVTTRPIVNRPVETIITQPSGTLMAQEPLVTVPSGTLVPQPGYTVQTVETVRTVRPAAKHVVRHQIITTRRTVVRQRIVPAQTVVARSVTYPQPLYDRVAPAPLAASAPSAAYPRPLYDAYPRPLYDDVANTDMVPAVAPAPGAAMAQPIADAPVVGAPGPQPLFGQSGASYSFYRYVYEPDRILVIDPNTNVAVQAIPR